MAIDHFVTHQRQQGRADWNLNILFNDQSQVAEYAAKYYQALQHHGLYEPVPSEWLHATVLRIGFFDDFSEVEMLEYASRLEARFEDIQMPEFLLGQWWIWGGNPCVHFTPRDPMMRMFSIVMEELTALVGADRLPDKQRLTPHITLAYSKSYEDEIELHRQLETVSAPAVSVRAKRLSLIKQWIVDHHYEWEVVKDIPLNQAD